MPVRESIVKTLIGKGLTSKSPDVDLKKAYFGTANVPLSAAMLPQLKAALDGDASAIISDADATAKKEAKAAKGGAPKAAKEPKPARVAETADAALARLKADPKTADRWKRVVRVEEMGKKGPTRVTILCDNKGADGGDLFRTINVQDLFQVRFSADYKRPKAAKAKAETEAK